MTDSTFGENSDIGCTATDVHHAYAQFTFIIGQDGIAGGKLFQNNGISLQATALYTALNILCCIDGTSNQMNLRFQTNTGHANGFFNTFLIVHHIFLRQHMQNPLILRNSNRLSCIDNPFNIGWCNLAIAHSNNPMGVHGMNVTPGNPGIYRMNGTAGHQLSLFYCTFDRLYGGLDIHHHTFLHATTRVRSQTNNFNRAIDA